LKGCLGLEGNVEMITGEAGPVLLLIAMLWAWTWMLITTIKFVVREKKRQRRNGKMG